VFDKIYRTNKLQSDDLMNQIVVNNFY